MDLRLTSKTGHSSQSSPPLSFLEAAFFLECITFWSTDSSSFHGSEPDPEDSRRVETANYTRHRRYWVVVSVAFRVATKIFSLRQNSFVAYTTLFIFHGSLTFKLFIFLFL